MRKCENCGELATHKGGGTWDSRNMHLCDDCRPCWCDWCHGRVGTHGDEAVRLYRAKVAAAMADYETRKQAGG